MSQKLTKPQFINDMRLFRIILKNNNYFHETDDRARFSSLGIPFRDKGVML